MKQLLGKTVLLVSITIFFFDLSASVSFASDNATNKNKIVIGKLFCDANPCTTDPCLPGVIMYIETLNENVYKLTINGSWIWDCVFEWNTIEHEDGDYTMIIGQIANDALEIKYIFNLKFISEAVL